MKKQPTKQPEFMRHKDAVVEVEMLVGVRAQVDALVREFVPPLHLQDAIGLAALGLSANLMSGLCRGFPLRKTYRIWCESRAVEIVFRSNPSLCTDAMNIPLLLTPELTVPRAHAWWTNWNAEVLTPIATSEKPGSIITSERRRCVYELARSIMRRFLASPAELCRGVWLGLRAERIERGAGERDKEEDRDENLVAEYWAISAALRDRDDLYFVGKDGKLRINPVYVRDARRSQREPMTSLDDVGGEENLSASVNDAVDAATAALGQADAQAAMQVIRAVVAERRAAAGSRPAPEQAVWENFEALWAGRTSCEILARDQGLKLRTVQAAWKKARDFVAGHPRLKRFAEDVAESA